MSFDPQPLFFWYRVYPINKFMEAGAIPFWLVVSGMFGLVVLSISILNIFIIHRRAGGRVLVRETAGCISDLSSISLRRVFALTKLTFLEAYRRKALAVFVVFGLLFMFAGWFMGGTGEITNDQVKIYVSFVLRAITWLTLPVVVVLSCFGIPEDIRLRSIHTVVTKPARRLEIVLGRILGFSLIGTVVLVVMSAVGYVWIVRQIPKEAKENGMLTCRVPSYGKLLFLDRSGLPVASGINVGDVWEFQSFIEGATAARAIWKFENVNELALDADGNLNLENRFSAFRSYKGDMKRQLFYDFKFTNPEKQVGPDHKPLSFTTEPREVNEFRGSTDKIPRKLSRIGEANTYDLINDFVTASGSLTVEVSCLDRQQYIGLARPDLFIRKPDQPFWYGYAKATFGIELLLLLVSIISVTASTFLKGPIAALTTTCLLLLGGEASHKFMDDLLIGLMRPEGFKGGGFLESIYRLVTHANLVTELPDNPAVLIMKNFDSMLTVMMYVFKSIIPRLKYFNMSDYVSNGFDVPWNESVVPSLVVTLGYFLPCVLLGYFALRIRELESK